MNANEVRSVFLLAMAKKEYDGAITRWLGLPWAKRIFARKPKNPASGGETAIDLANAYTRAANELFFGNALGRTIKGDNGTWVDAEVSWQSIGSDHPYYPVVCFLYYDGSCFFRRRIGINPDGGTTVWGLDIPYDDCGVNQLPQPSYMDEQCRPVLNKFQEAIKGMQEIVQESRSRL